MTDIVARLRSRSPYLKDSAAERDMEEAADEIEKLRAENQTAWNQAEEQVRSECRQECRALLCERNERCMALLYDTPGFYERIRAAMEPKP